MTPLSREWSRLLVFALTLLSLLAVGCGGSTNDDVFTATEPQPPGTTGNALFRFMLGQREGVVPAGTTRLFFEFYSSAEAVDGLLVHTAESDFDTLVVVPNVPTSSRLVLVTAYGPGGVPLATLTGAVNITAGRDNPVSLSDPTAVTFDSITVSPNPINLVQGTQNGNTRQLSIVGAFSNGDTVTFASTTFATNADFDGFDPTIASVSDSGQASGVSNGDTEVIVRYTANGQTQSSTVPINVTGGVVAQDTLTVTPESLQLAQGDASATLTAFFAEAGEQPVNVTGSAYLSFALEAPVTGVSVNNETGAVTVDNDAVNNSSATVVASYDDGVGGFAEDTVAVTVGPILITNIELVSLRGRNVRMIGGGSYPLLLALSLSHGVTSASGPGQTLAEGDYGLAFSSTNGVVASVDGDGYIVFGNTTGNATITLEATGGEQVSFTAQNINPGGVTQLDITPTELAVVVGATVDYSVSLRFADNSTQDVTAIIFPDFDSADGGFVQVVFDNLTSATLGLVRGVIAGSGNLNASSGDFYPGTLVPGPLETGSTANVTVTAAVSP